jgi:hypothetical protein
LKQVIVDALHHHRGRRLAALAAVAIGCMVVAGCHDGGENASVPDTVRNSSAATLCGKQGAVERLVVVRHDRLPHDGRRFSVPARAKARTPVQAQDVARALCSLPRARVRGTVACPLDSGVIYRLTFVDGPRVATSHVTLRVSGCATATGVGLARSFPADAGLWHALGRAIGRPHATWATFRGDL